MVRTVVRRKITIINAETPFGKPVETIYEYTDKDEVLHKCTSKKKLHSFVAFNKMKERVEVCKYWGSDFVNVFISGGVHDMRFALNETQVGTLIHMLTMIKNSMWKVRCRTKDKQEVNCPNIWTISGSKTPSDRQKEA